MNASESESEQEPEQESDFPPSYRQCTARSSQTGERCKKSAIKGGTVCRSHGGGSPAVKRAAKLRLLELVDPAIATLARTLTKADAKDSDKLRAVENILDRAGHPRTSANISIDDAQDELLEKLLALRQQSLEEEAAADAEAEDDHTG